MRGMKHAVRTSEGPPPSTAVYLDPEGPCLAGEELLRSAPDIVVGGVVELKYDYDAENCDVFKEDDVRKVYLVTI